MRTGNEDWPPGKIQIRDAALVLFAEHGPEGVSMREIASAAGVSLGLLVHHFGTKQRLRHSVDDHVAETLEQIVSAVVQEPATFAADGLGRGVAEVVLARLPANSPMPAYLRRLILSGDAAGHALFRHWFELTAKALGELEGAGLVRTSADPAMRAALLLLSDLAMLLLRWHVVDVVGVDPLSPEGARRWSAAATDLYLNGMASRDR